MRFAIISIICCIMLSACALLRPARDYVNANVSSLASQAAQQKRSYIIVPGNKDIRPDDLQFQEYATELSRALQTQGFVPAKDVEDANAIIVLSYGIGDPQTHQYSFALPIYGQTGIASSYTSGVINSYGGAASYSGMTTYTPTYGVTGYMPVNREFTTYFRYVLVAAYDLGPLRDSKHLVELWQTTIASTGSSGDLRRVYPVLIAAAMPYFATDTGKQVHVRLLESDDAVKLVEGQGSD